MVDVDRLKELLHYEPTTGVFVWVKPQSNRTKVGARAGNLAAVGYRRVGVDGELYWEHRLAWLYMHGSWPRKHLDHVNRDRTDNRIANLREATDAENMQNLGRTVKNTSGFVGATRRGDKWIGQIGVEGRTHYLGVFPTPEAAHAAYLEAKKRLHTFEPIFKEAA